jgi:hypothetical protein
MNAARVFLDTNILLYLYSDADPVKQKRASDLVGQLGHGGVLLSTQTYRPARVPSASDSELPDCVHVEPLNDTEAEACPTTPRFHG